MSTVTEPTIEPKGYNGWTNYETWNVNPRLDNEEGDYRYWQERAQEVYDAAVGTQYTSRDDQARYDLASALKEAIRNENDPLGGTSSMYADLLDAALCDVNYYEIAESMLEDVTRESDDDEEED